MRLVIVVFPTEDAAETAWPRLKAARKEHIADIHAAVAIRKDSQSQFHYRDVGMTPGKGAAGGAVLGAVLGVMTGGATLALGALGAVIGGLVGRKRRESRFPAEQVNQIAASLAPGSSALVVVAREGTDALEQELQTPGAEVFTVDLTADITAQITARQDEAYAALIDNLAPSDGQSLE